MRARRLVIGGQTKEALILVLVIPVAEKDREQSERIDLLARGAACCRVDLRELAPCPPARVLRFNPPALHAPLDHGVIEIAVRGVIKMRKAGVEFAAVVQTLHAFVW